MATVVVPYRNTSWDQVPDTIARLVGTIMDRREAGSEDADAALMAQTDPERLKDIVPQLKSRKMRQLALQTIWQNRPQDVYTMLDGELIKSGQLPAGAKMVDHDLSSAKLAMEARRLKQSQYSEPIAGQIDGRDVYFRVNKATGEPELLSGIGGLGPRPQRPEAQVNIDQRGELVENQEWAKQMVAEYKGLDEAAKAAEQLIPQFDIAKSIDVKTGALEPLKAKAGALIQGMGFNPENLGLPDAGNAQAITGVLNNVVLTKMQAQKGPQTENDAKRIEQTVGNLGNTPEAFGFLLDAGKALEERKIEQRDFYAAYRGRTGTLQGASAAWNKYKADHPLVGKSPSNDRPVFLNDFLKEMRKANPKMTLDQMMQVWREDFSK